MHLDPYLKRTSDVLIQTYTSIGQNSLLQECIPFGSVMEESTLVPPEFNLVEGWEDAMDKYFHALLRNKVLAPAGFVVRARRGHLVLYLSLFRPTFLRLDA